MKPDEANGLTVKTCQWSCEVIARFRVSGIRRGKPQGGYFCCGRHLTRAVQYVTVPGSAAHVENLE